MLLLQEKIVRMQVAIGFKDIERFVQNLVQNELDERPWNCSNLSSVIYQWDILGLKSCHNIWLSDM